VPVLFPDRRAVEAWHWPLTLSSAQVKERVELYLYCTLDLRGLVLGELYFLYRSHCCGSWHYSVSTADINLCVGTSPTCILFAFRLSHALFNAILQSLNYPEASSSHILHALQSIFIPFLSHSYLLLFIQGSWFTCYATSSF